MSGDFLGGGVALGTVTLGEVEVVVGGSPVVLSQKPIDGGMNRVQGGMQ